MPRRAIPILLAVLVAFPPVAVSAVTRAASVRVTTLNVGGVIEFIHPGQGVIATIPLSNRATYAQIVVLSRPKITSANIFTLGQSGFIRLLPPDGFETDPHFMDQLGLFRRFEYKPMRLLQNTRDLP